MRGLAAGDAEGDHQRQVVEQLQRRGGTAGLVAMEDVLEEIVGNIQDEHDEGEEIEIQRLPDGSYELNGQRYKSLSAAARAITGTHWSGPAFFGVKGGRK